MMNIELLLTQADPEVLYTEGPLLDKNDKVYRAHVVARLAEGTVIQGVPSGLYTCSFSASRGGKLTVLVRNADSGTALQIEKPIDATKHLDGHTYSFVVP